MTSCPTCKAKYKGGNECYRCKSDLSVLLNIENESLRHFQNALAFTQKGQWLKAYEENTKSLFLNKTEQANKLRLYLYARLGYFEKIIFSLKNNTNVALNDNV
jgi:hypothetical protein